MAREPEEKVEVIKASANPTKKATIVVIGLDNAGKSTIVNHFAGSSGSPTAPTMGFELNKATVGDFAVKFFGLGGSSSIRGYWDNYFDEVHGIIYVVDAADADRVEESAEAFKAVMTNTRAQGKPVLVYLNKQDLKSTLSAAELAPKLGVDTDVGLVNIVPASALDASPPAALIEGLEWLLKRCDQDRDQLEARIATDAAERKAAQRKKMEANREERRSRPPSAKV
jgi:small GTP-binding protein